MNQKIKSITLSLACLALVNMTLASVAFADSKSPIGSWRIDNGEGNVALISYHDDGNVLLTVPGFPSGHGTWEKVTSKVFVAKTVAISGADPIVISTVTDVLEISEDGRTYVSEFETVLTLVDGTEIGTVTGSTTASRITVD